MIRTWLAARRKRKQCFHHDWPAGRTIANGRSFIVDQLIDLGRRKMYRCTRCGQIWFG